jgi:cardiolipin synthase
MKKFRANQIPNYISMFRIILIPIYVLLFFGLLPSLISEPLVSAGIVFIIAGISDAVDGFLARKNHWITDIGKLLDPLADKLLEVVVAVCLAIKFGGPFTILATIIVFKEIIMIVGAYLIMSKSNVYVSSVWCGKLATIVWYILLCVVHFFPMAAEANLLLSYFLCIVLILVMNLAFVVYAFNYASQIQSTKDALFKKNDR